MKPKAGEKITRWQVHTGKAPSVRTRPPPLFWVEVCFNKIKDENYVKGLPEGHGEGKGGSGGRSVDPIWLYDPP